MLFTIAGMKCPISAVILTFPLSLALLSSPVSAKPLSEGPVEVFPCRPAGGAKEARQSATLVNWQGKSYLIAVARDPARGQWATTCSRNAGLPSDQALTSLASDDRLALTLFELPSPSAMAFELNTGGLVSPYDIQVRGQRAEINSLSSERHLLGDSASMIEVSTPESADEPLSLNQGAALTAEGQLAGVLSDQTIIALPGQPAKVFRSHDLALLTEAPSTYFRLAFTTGFLRQWMAQVLSPGWSPRLRRLSPTSTESGVAITQWRVKTASASWDIEERCLSDSARESDAGNYPVGGGEAVGVGGLEDVLSSCQLRRVIGSEKKRIELAYRRADETLQTRSLQNVHTVLNLVEKGGWNLLIESEPLDRGQGAVLLETAQELRNSVISIYQKFGGNPLVLRQAFLLASLLQSADWREVRLSDLDQLRRSIDRDLPDSVGTDDWRVRPELSPFARAKSALIKQLLLIRAEREKR